MNIERKLIDKMELSEFADKHGLTLLVVEREDGSFYAHFKNAEVVGDGVLISDFGNGSDEDSAILNYALKISLKSFVLNFNTPNMKEIRVPKLFVKRTTW